VRRAHRVAVADGPWSGTMTGADGATLSVQLGVSARGRMVKPFSFELYCPGAEPASSQPAYGVGPDVNGRFIAADGTFGAGLPGTPIAWHGRFAAGVLNGSISSLGRACGLDPGALSGRFTATPTR